MGNRKPPVREKLKIASRKYHEGKIDEAESYAVAAGKAAAQSCNIQAIDKAGREFDLPKKLISIAQHSSVQDSAAKKPKPIVPVAPVQRVRKV